jgi:hypothetical protein
VRRGKEVADQRSSAALIREHVAHHERYALLQQPARDFIISPTSAPLVVQMFSSCREMGEVPHAFRLQAGCSTRGGS